MIANAKLKAIATRASEDLVAFIGESEAKILDAWHAAEEEAQDNDTKPKFRMGMTIVLDLDRDVMRTALTFGSKRKLSRDGNIPDPDQANLPLEKEEQ